MFSSFSRSRFSHPAGFTTIMEANCGFTLIELLIVIAIIGVLSTLGMVNYLAVRQRARDSQRKVDLSVIASALEQYKGDSGNYPSATGSSLGTCKQPFTSTDNSITYIKKFPCDPLQAGQPFNSGKYAYLTSGTDYTLIACLENTQDTGGVPASQLPSGIPSGCSSGKYYEFTDGNAGGSTSWSSGFSAPPTPTPTLTLTPTLTPTPTPLPVMLVTANSGNTITVPSGVANGLLAVSLYDPPSTTPLYDSGTPLTSVAGTNNQLWYLVNPSSGAHSITNDTGDGGIAVYKNVSQTQPFGIAGSGANPETISTTSTNQLVTDIMVHNYSVSRICTQSPPYIAESFTPNTGQTLLWPTTTSAIYCGCSGGACFSGTVTITQGGASWKQAQPGSTSMGWSSGTNDIEVPINPSP